VKKLHVSTWGKLQGKNHYFSLSFLLFFLYSLFASSAAFWKTWSASGEKYVTPTNSEQDRLTASKWPLAHVRANPVDDLQQYKNRDKEGRTQRLR
jgi:hypothetical protein